MPASPAVMMETSPVIRGGLAIGCLSSKLYSFVLPSASHPCLLSRLLLALNAGSCGVKLWQTIGKGIHFEIWHFPGADSF